MFSAVPVAEREESINALTNVPPLCQRLEASLTKRGVPHRRSDAADLDTEAHLCEAHDFHEVKAVLDYAMKDDFWRDRVRTLHYFGRKYDELRHQARSSGALKNRPLTDEEKQAKIDRQVEKYRRLVKRMVEDELQPDGSYVSRPIYTLREDIEDEVRAYEIRLRREIRG